TGALLEDVSHVSKAIYAMWNGVVWAEDKRMSLGDLETEVREFEAKVIKLHRVFDDKRTSGVFFGRPVPEMQVTEKDVQDIANLKSSWDAFLQRYNLRQKISEFYLHDRHTQRCLEWATELAGF